MAEANGSGPAPEEQVPNAGAPPPEVGAAEGGRAAGARGSVVGEADAGAVAGAAGRAKPVKEVIDELAHDTTRASLLDAVEEQLKNQEHMTRLVFACQVTDEKRVQSQVEREFQNWLAENSVPESKELSGFSLLLSVSPSSAIVTYLEGNTELIFSALKFFDELSIDKSSDGGRVALVSSLRVIYFTEMHRNRLVPGWLMYVHPTKAGPANQQNQEVNPKSTIFLMYKKLITLACKVKLAAREDETNKQTAARNTVKNSTELFPTIDEALVLTGKLGQEFLFSYKEFESTFIAPFHTVLQSELLWPMPPPLSY